MKATIRELRVRRRIPQSVLADLAGIDRVFLARIERGTRAPSVRTLVRLAVALKVAPSDLLKRLTPSTLRGLKLD